MQALQNMDNLMVAGSAAIFMWWFENHDEKTDSGNEKEGN